MSQSAVSRIWRAFALQPHRSETFKLSKDPLFIEKVRDVVGLYLHPPNKAMVLCVDEKSQIQALDRSHDDFYTTTGFATSLASAQQMGEAIAKELKAAQVDAVLLVST